MPLDDSIGRILDIIQAEEPTPSSPLGSGDLAGQLATIGGVFSPFLGVYSAFQAAFSVEDRNHRFKTAIAALCRELDSLRDKLPTNARDALEAKWFRHAVSTLVQEVSRAEDEERAELLAIVTAHGCVRSDGNEHRQEDLASYIRDLARLGMDDLKMFRMICVVYQSVTATTPNLNMPDAFTRAYPDYKTEVGRLGMHPDDAVALGSRLTGFGLAFETMRNPTAQSPEDIFFRPTRRGLYLYGLLVAAERSTARTKP